jgi:membrane protease YdiL (CAAX protease family)
MSTSGSAQARPATDGPTPAPDRTQLAIALIITLLISRLPEIVLRDVVGMDIPTLAWPIAALVITTVLWLGARVVAWLRPFERYLAVMIAVSLAIVAVDAIFTSDVWATLVPPTTQPMILLLAERVVLAGLGLLVIGAALALGATRQEAYLVVGDLDGPTNIRRSDGQLLGWKRFGPIAFVGLMLLMVWFAVPQLPDDIDLAAAVPFIAVGAVAALLNAFWEEAAFRAAPLSMLQRAIGPSAGVIVLALWFGLGHYYGGIPSGAFGAFAAGAVALLFGRAMIETRGLGWPLALHFAGDFVIYTFLAIASVA